MVRVERDAALAPDDDVVIVAGELAGEAQVLVDAPGRARHLARLHAGHPHGARDGGLRPDVPVSDDEHGERDGDARAEQPGARRARRRAGRRPAQARLTSDAGGPSGAGGTLRR
ncbi:hypothetical protein E1286_37295 [Nonomuraea terrae]|uniref:Uncharacterized protein n=1 Tax=Nonomuraea terrae TaxID=2530383 RepID=A0A4R4Y050_9ACTN|nr:hypothetical protein [Nonomuraea terrae]TDD37336.1 hypothetical protein E1286_37295 [Nonomuraea terrae]